MSNSAKRRIIIGVVLIVCSGVLFGLVVMQVNRQGNELTSYIDTLEAEQAQEQSYIKLQRLAEATVEDRETVQQYFLLRESDSIDFLNQIEGLAPTVGVALETEDLVIKEEKDSAWVEVVFSFSGTRENVDRFIELLESVAYVSRILSVNLQARSGIDWEASVTMQIRILEYED